MAQTWSTLLFAHWPVPVAALERVLPPQLQLDTFDGQAWIGVTPFEVRNLRLRPMLPIPWLSHFPEINVRTYVTFAGRPGIYFFSLDTARRLAVTAARRFYRLPYFHASMRMERTEEEISYRSVRIGPEEPPAQAEFQGQYAPVGRLTPRQGALSDG